MTNGKRILTVRSSEGLNLDEERGEPVNAAIPLTHESESSESTVYVPCGAVSNGSSASEQPGSERAAGHRRSPPPRRPGTSPYSISNGFATPPGPATQSSCATPEFRLGLEEPVQVTLELPEGERARIHPIEPRPASSAIRDQTVSFEGLKSLRHAGEI